MTANLAAGAPPIFARGSYLNRFADQAGDLVLSHSQGLRHRLYDMSRRSFVEFAGSEAQNAVATFGIWDQGTQIGRSIDLVAVMGHNCADLKAEFSEDNGATYPTVENAAGLTTADKVFTLASAVNANKLRITAQATQTPGQAKKIGMILVGSLILQPAAQFAAFEPLLISGQKLAQMGNNSLRVAYTYHADDDYVLKNYAVGFEALTRSELRDLEDKILHHREPMIFIPFPGDLPDEVAFVTVDASTWRYKPTNKVFLGSGWDLDFVLRSVGAA